MTVTAAERNRLLAINVEEHAHIVDSFSSLGREPDAIAIRQGIDLEYVILILKAYNLKLGKAWGDEEDDCGVNKRVPERVVKEYVREYYPGILEGTEPGMTMGRYILEATPSED
ncbi:MAG: hypothetical protein VB031_02485 [Eubacteriaceae bacterium]|nr:hypothetical protein [Eubacteriaceae bacterium]